MNQAKSIATALVSQSTQSTTRTVGNPAATVGVHVAPGSRDDLPNSGRPGHGRAVMRLQHNLGGLENLGPIDYERRVFVEDWEKRIFGIHTAMMGLSSSLR